MIIKFNMKNQYNLLNKSYIKNNEENIIYLYTNLKL